MPRRLSTLAALLPALFCCACVDQAAGAGEGARDQIKAVGSSTVYPFTTIVAEQYLANHPAAKPPVIESTGTGAGMKLFCAGIGARHPDIEGASRRMKRAEYDQCRRNGVAGVMEVQVGIDGIAFAEALDGPRMALTSADLYRALALAPGGRPNRARTWRDVNPALPATPIQVYGPPATSGTRDALAELILAKGCLAVDPAAAALKVRDEAAFQARCQRVREDGGYIDAGENDNLIVQKLQANPQAIGIFGYGYLEENLRAVRGVAVDGVTPDYRAIAAGRYPGARPLYLYVKISHLHAIPGLRAFLRDYARLWSDDGPLVRRGLIASPPAVRAAAARTIVRETPLDPATLN